MHLAYNNIGILKYENMFVSGEYSLMISKEFPNAEIYAFEPNKNTFDLLTQNVNQSVKCFNIGLGSKEKNEEIYTYSDNLSISHANVYGEVFSEFHKNDNIVTIGFQVNTLDKFCEQEKVNHIDFLKIGTEGNELDVLKGGRKMISAGRVKLI